MDPSPDLYQPPPEHENELRTMGRILACFFCVITLLLGLLIVYAHHILPKIPFEQERAFIRPYQAWTEKWLAERQTPDQLKTEAYLQSLADDLAATMVLPEHYQIEVHYLDTDAVNAFATLGGNIFVCKGLLAALPDENSLAMVLAHEIAHIKHRDPLVSMSRGAMLQLLYSYVVGDYASGQDLVSLGGDLGMLYFSRSQEQAADEQALQALQAYFGHVAGYDSLFQLLVDDTEKDRLQSDKRGQISSQEWLSTHPELKSRIEHLRSLAESHHWREGEKSPLPERVKLSAEK